LSQHTNDILVYIRYTGIYTVYSVYASFHIRLLTSLQVTEHRASSEHTVTSRHGIISNQSPNEQSIRGRNCAHSSTERGEAVRKETGSSSHRRQEQRTAAATSVVQLNRNGWRQHQRRSMKNMQRSSSGEAEGGGRFQKVAT
jgi:hypothetical protein